MVMIIRFPLFKMGLPEAANSRSCNSRELIGALDSVMATSGFTSRLARVLAFIFGFCDLWRIPSAY